MNVSLDECAPRALKQAIAPHGHECLTVQQAGWSGKPNGDPLDLAEQIFDVLVTIDTKLGYQQNLSGRRIAITLIAERSNRLRVLERHFAACAEAIDTIQPGQFVRLGGSQEPARGENM